MAEWTYFYLDPALKNTNQNTWKRVGAATDSNTLRNGDIVEVWNHVFRWDEHCIPQKEMLTWQARGDKLVDAALPFIQDPVGDAGGTDQYERLAVVAVRDDAAPEVLALWKHLHTIDSFAWPDKAQLERGRAVFYRYAEFILASLLHWSLSAGFCSPKISRVLNLASYLCPPMSSSPEGETPRITPQSNDRSYKRLMETTQFVVDCTAPDALAVGGSGWRSAIRVRLLHATMRRRLLLKSRDEWKTRGYSAYDERVDGIPINQADIAGTLIAFSTSSMHCLRKIGLSPTPQECADWTALWRVIGYYLGIDADILCEHHSNFAQSESLLASVMIDIFAGETDPPPPCQFPFQQNLVSKQQQVIHVTHEKTKVDPYTAPPTLPVLLCLCNRWPIPYTFPQHCAATRQLLGPSLSDWLSVPRTTWFDAQAMRLGYTLGTLPPRFSRIYRAGWDEKRRQVMEKTVRTAIALSLGLRQTKYRPRKPDEIEPAKVGDEFFGESRLRDVKTELQEWGLLYLELVAVVSLCAFLFFFFAPLTIPATAVWMIYTR